MASRTGFVGFDSAWTDNNKAPGAICATVHEGGLFTGFEPPRLVSFQQALTFIQDDLQARTDLVIIAIDQPTIVPNSTGCRPVERVAGSLISWLGGGVQPSNRGRAGMFDDKAPIWRFLQQLGGVEDPERARSAIEGLYYFEVFPALALASLSSAFFGRLCAPRYNPGRGKTFRLADWRMVADVAAGEAGRLGCSELAKWCHSVRAIERPRKSDQDCLDAAICLLVCLRWRLDPRESSIIIGDLRTGYMIAPVTDQVRLKLEAVARTRDIRIDGEP